MEQIELVGVNREMSIIKIKKTDESGVKYVQDVNLNTISIQEFFNLCSSDILNINEDFLAEIDVMLDEAVNPEVRELYSEFLIIRDKLVNSFLLDSFEDSGKQIVAGEKSFYDNPNVALSDINLYINKDSNSVETLFGLYTPEFFKPVWVNFDDLNDVQKLGFIQALPEGFIDDKMFEYFFSGCGKVDISNCRMFKMKDVCEYQKINKNVDVEKILKSLSIQNTPLYDFALEKMCGEEYSK